jgi:hypothetical protein
MSAKRQSQGSDKVIDFLVPGFLYSVLKDSFAAIRGKRRRLSASEALALRQKWKPLFEAEIRKNHYEKLRSDVIIRDMRRIDSYPDITDTKGISPWFRANLVDTYHRGIFIALSWGTLNRHGDGERWRYTNYAAKEEPDIKALLIGRIPYEKIENVDWNGDEYYHYPHIYCFFTYKREPYEGLGFYTEHARPDLPPYYTEIAPYQDVRRLSRQMGIRHFG